MLCEKVLGKLSDEKFKDLKVDYVDIDWYDAFKKLHKKVSVEGREVGIRLDNDILTKGLNQDDVLGVDGDTVVAVNIPPCDVIVAKVAENHPHIVPKVCYEIGNRHATLFYGDTHFEYITPLNQPMLDMLNKIHGVTATVVNMKLNFDKSISSTINNHTH